MARLQNGMVSDSRSLRCLIAGSRCRPVIYPRSSAGPTWLSLGSVTERYGVTSECIQAVLRPILPWRDTVPGGCRRPGSKPVMRAGPEAPRRGHPGSGRAPIGAGKPGSTTDPLSWDPQDDQRAMTMGP